MSVKNKGVTLDWVREFVQRWEGFWNAKDKAGLLSLVAEDVVWHDDAVPEPMVGRESVDRFLTHYMTNIPADLVFETVSGPYALADEDRGALEWRATATLPDGPIVVHGADFYRFRDNQLAEVRILFQNNEQISAIIPPVVP